MKILFITDLYPIESGERNSVRTLHNFVLGWIGQNHTVEVVRPNFVLNSVIRGKKLHKTGFYDFEGVKIFNVNYLSPFLFDIEKKLQIHDLKTYDLIIAHMPSGIIFANRLFEKHKKTTLPKFVCGVHSSDLEVLTNPLYKFYFKSQMEKAYNKAEKIACRSFVLQKKFSELYPKLAEKTFVAASGVKIDLEKPRFETLTPPIKVLTCANLIKRKNIDKLILAVKELEGFELTIIGDGKEFKKLNSIGRMSFPAQQHKVKFLGKLPQEKVFEQMKNSHIFILPSVNETFGMVYMEAMASGCVTVCTKNDGIDGIIKDGENGFLTHATVEGIKETLSRIKSSKNLDEIRNNSLETVKNYTLEFCAENYLKNCKV